MCKQGHLGSNRLICMHLDTTMGKWTQLQSSELICIHLAATMCNHGHLGTNRLIYMHLCLINCFLGRLTHLHAS